LENTPYTICPNACPFLQENNSFQKHFNFAFCVPRVPYESRNFKSVLNNPAIAWEKVMNELNAGRIAGPFSYRPISNLRV
jgi:hypothetical protein